MWSPWPSPCWRQCSSVRFPRTDVSHVKTGIRMVFFALGKILDNTFSYALYVFVNDTKMGKIVPIQNIYGTSIKKILF